MNECFNHLHVTCCTKYFKQNTSFCTPDECTAHAVLSSCHHTEAAVYINLSQLSPHDPRWHHSMLLHADLFMNMVYFFTTKMFIFYLVKTKMLCMAQVQNLMVTNKRPSFQNNRKD